MQVPVLWVLDNKNPSLIRQNQRNDDKMLITLDFETAFSRELTLKKMTTEEYVRHPSFRVHGVGYKINGEPARYVYAKDKIDKLFALLPWGKAVVLCHNTLFDGFILSDRYGVHPKFFLDTMSMGKALFPHESASLDNLSKKILGREKGKELASFEGKTRLTDEEQDIMGRYCRNDVELTYDLWRVMKQDYPLEELRVIDTTLKMFTDPVLLLDKPLLEEHLVALRKKKADLLGQRDITSLRSNEQFAALLRLHGVTPPTKISLRTGKETYAFSKTDEGMVALLDHPDEEVQLLASARLGVKSSIEESRSELFLAIADRGPLPVHLQYCGAGNSGRFCLTADTIVTVLRDGFVYDIFLPEVRTDDLVWDGEEFVAHDGVIEYEPKEVMSYGGITGTPDHKVFLENGETISLLEASQRKYQIAVGETPPRQPVTDIDPSRFCNKFPQEDSA